MVNADVPEPELPYDGTDVMVSTDAYLKWYGDHSDHLATIIGPAKQRLRDVLASHGIVASEDPRLLPIIRAVVPVELLRSQQLNDVDIVRIDESPRDGSILGFAGNASMNASSLTGGACSGLCDGGHVAVGLWERDAGSVISGIGRNNSRIYSTVLGYKQSLTTCIADADCSDSDRSVERFCVQPLTSGATCPNGVRNCQRGDSCVDGYCVSPTKVCAQDHLTWVAASVGMKGSYSYNTTVPAGPDPTPNVAAGTVIGTDGAWNVNFKVGNDVNSAGFDYLLSSAAADGGIATPFIDHSYSSTPYFIDWAGRALGTFVVASAGNNGTTAMVACGRLRNGLCVGWYDYKTYNDLTTHMRTESGTGNWGSNYVNDPSTYVERPHLLGPGSHDGINSGLHMPQINAPIGYGTMEYKEYVTGSGYSQIGGSSFSAPAVLSAAIQAQQYEGWLSALAFPMVNKAVLLASTQDSNADGQIGKSQTWSQAADAEDGAGQLNLSYVKQILDNNQYYWANLADGDFVACGTGCRKVPISITIPAGKSVRAALAWQSCLTSEATVPVINNDLDLALNCGNPMYNCGGTIQSNSVADEIEMVFKPVCPLSVTCSLEIRIKNGATLQSCGSTTTERVGVSWAFRS